MWSKLRQRIGQWRIVLITAPSVTGIVMAAGAFGAFGHLEWATFDQFFRWRPQPSPDPRIVIITVDDNDINFLGRWPIPDRTLAQLIAKINSQKPRAIGLDLYRDLPVEPGHEELVNQFKSIPHLIGVEKAVKNKVPPPPTLKQLNRVGFADVIIDADGKVRRALLSIRRKNEPTKSSLSLTLALKYLEAEGITLERINGNSNQLKLGRAIFKPFQGNDGGYVNTNSGGYQILLNYRGSQKNFYTIPLRDVLQNRIAPDVFQSRIVLIGSSGQSFNDFFFTPYRNSPFGSPKRVPGVVIHANILSQILDAAFGERPLIQVWPEPIEWLWTLIWSFISGAGSWILLKNQNNDKNLWRWIAFGISIVLAGGILVGGSYVAFLASWWIPVIPAITSLGGSAFAIAFCHGYQLQREKSDLELLLEMTTEHADAIATQLENKAEEIVRTSEEKLAQFLEAIPVGVAVLDAEGKPYYANRVAQKILGKGVVPNAPTAELNQIYQTYIAGTDQLYPNEKLPIIRALKGEAYTCDDLEIHQGNKIIPLESWGTPVYDESGKVSYAIVAFQDITERKKAEEVRTKLTEQLIELNVAYSRFVPIEFLQLLKKESILDVELGDQVQQEMSVLFADIRNFTSLSESMTPEDNFRFINAYLSRMEPAIVENQGFIDKYIGDGIMALFTSSDRAVTAAINMLHKLADFNRERALKGLPYIQIGIGINTGSMMLGTVGGHSRMDGTVISDAVNLASRIEGLTKNYGVALLISHHTFLSLNNPADYAFRLIDRVQVKGKSQKVTVYEVFDADIPEVKQQKLSTKTLFEQALLLYYLGHLSEAAQLFQTCLSVYPKDKVAKIYLERCQQPNSNDVIG